MCTTCPGGYSCGTSTTVTPTLCLAGTYAASGASSCSLCSKGYECPQDGMSAQSPCGNGTYSDSTSATSCTACPAGNIYTFNLALIVCLYKILLTIFCSWHFNFAIDQVLICSALHSPVTCACTLLYG